MDRITRLVVVTLIAFVVALTVWMAVRPASGRVDAAQLCVGFSPDEQGVCIPLP